MKDKTLIILDIDNKYDKDTTIQLLDKFISNFKIMLGEDNTIVLIDYCASLDISNKFFFGIFKAFTNVWSYSDLKSIEIGTKYSIKNAIIVTEKDKSIRSLYYDILGFRIPSHSVKIWLLDV